VSGLLRLRLLLVLAADGVTSIGWVHVGVVKFALVAGAAVDRYLIVNGEPRRPAALVLVGDAAALDALEAVRVDGRRRTSVGVMKPTDVR
jgi:hypothetical protein